MRTAPENQTYPRPNPRPLGSANRHYWMALSMAKTTGADLQKALKTGLITHADWAQAVHRCRGCQWTEGCDAWMAAQQRGAAKIPVVCRNAALFEHCLD